MTVLQAANSPSEAKVSLLRIYAISFIVTIAIWIGVCGYTTATAGILAGLLSLMTIVILTILEVTFSFDNAVVNSKLLQRMSKFWQTLFMTVGIFIAVFLVRFVLPVFIVQITSGLGFVQVIDMAIFDSVRYGAEVSEAGPLINAFGSAFLAMLVCTWLFDLTKETHWIVAIEKRCAPIGRFNHVATLLVSTGALAISLFIHVEDRSQYVILLAAASGIVLHLVLEFFGEVTESGQDEDVPAVSRGRKLQNRLIAIAKLDSFNVTIAGLVAAVGGGVLVSYAGVSPQVLTVLWCVFLIVMVMSMITSARQNNHQEAQAATELNSASPNPAIVLVGSAAAVMFLRLEVLDASFSFDGVIGAFAITSSVILIMGGLGAGAMWVRSMTVHLVRAGTLARFRYLEHGAMWAIAALATFMVLKLAELEPPEWATGSIGVVFIGAAIWSSVRANRRDSRANTAS